MFSALKKLTSKQDATSAPPDTAVQPMSGSLQKKFSRGVNYNMKIIIKGDRNVGKSCLLQRLKGGGFIESYTPTEEIQVASIQWSFKATEDIVKVEVWDVVDRGKARPRHTGLKLSTAAMPDTPALDAEFLDVYKGTHGVVLMMDVTKAWTFEYVCKELPKIPSEIPVLILGNHCDMGHHRVISPGQASSLVETYGEGRPSEVLYAESSMRNGFGLRLLHKFLGLPFLRLQKETLLALIERNKRDTEICGFEIAEFLKSSDSDYNKFLNNLSNKRRQIADSNSSVPNNNAPIVHSTSNSSIGSQKSITSPTELRPTKSIIIGGGHPIVVPGQVNLLKNKEPNIPTTMVAAPTIAETSVKSVLVTTLLKNPESRDANPLSELRQLATAEQTVSVEEFCPDEGVLDRSFLDDIPTAHNDVHNQGLLNDDSDSDNDAGNPMVAKFNDDPDYYDDVRSDSKSSSLDGETRQKSKKNPLLKHRKSSDSTNILVRKSSTSSEELPRLPTTYDASFEENSDSWLAESSVRRSPEGGEDTTSVPSINQDVTQVQGIDSAEKKTKHKKKKEKKEDRKEKKKKRRSKEIDLENFLNGTVDDSSRLDEAYEAF